MHMHMHMYMCMHMCMCMYHACMYVFARWRGRRDPQHAYHAYLASLPAVPDDVACWPAAHRGGGLEATPVAGEVQQAVDLAECPYLLEAPPWWSHSLVWYAQPPWADAMGAGLLRAPGERDRAAQSTS